MAQHSLAFFFGFVLSFIGSIPPGTLNMTILQLALKGKTQIAFRFAIAVAIVEYPYAWIGVALGDWITSSPAILGSMQLITAIVMIGIGILNFIPSSGKKRNLMVQINNSGFRRGIVMSLLNPMAIPYWMGFTAYLVANGWLKFTSEWELHLYVLGTSLGALALLVILIELAQRMAPVLENKRWVKILPGLTLIALGLYSLGSYFHVNI